MRSCSWRSSSAMAEWNRGCRGRAWIEGAPRAARHPVEGEQPHERVIVPGVYLSAGDGLRRRRRSANRSEDVKSMNNRFIDPPLPNSKRCRAVVRYRTRNLGNPVSSLSCGVGCSGAR